ncbi:MAG: S26 family signal peptidase [Bacteroidales bacterium]
MEKKVIPNNQALSVIEDFIRNGESVRLKVRGNSMAPLLLDGLDHVTLIPLNGKEMGVGDIIFFRYKGSFLMHRIVKTDPASIVTKGDALKTCEEIKHEDVIAKISLPVRYDKWWYLQSKRILWRLIKIYIFARGVLLNSDI